MTTDTVVANAADEYSGPYFGTGVDHMIRQTEMDAFIAGVAWVMGHPDEYQRLRKEWP